MKRSVGKLPLLGLIRLLTIPPFEFRVLLILVRRIGKQAFMLLDCNFLFLQQMPWLYLCSAGIKIIGL